MTTGITYVGTDDADVINGLGTGNDCYDLLGGDDLVIENAGNDTYIGGLGSDLIFDKGGNDTYIFNIGDGQDRIYDLNGSDTVQFGAGINKANTDFNRIGDDVVINLRETTDSITVKNWYVADPTYNYKIEYVQFADNTSYSMYEVEQIVDGTLVVGTDYADVLTGNAADNTMIGYMGDDVYTGGVGNDFIVDDVGNEVYNYNLGDGQDTISDYAGADVINLGAGISRSNLTFTQNGNDLVIGISDTDSITVTNWYLDAANQIETLQFADGTFMTNDEINQGAPILPEPTITGTDGHDVLFGTLGNDTIMGGGGFDVLHDHGGSDTYLFNKGDGLDYLMDMSLKVSDDVDTIIFGADVAKTDVTFFMEGNNLQINYGAGDEVVVNNQEHKRKGIEVVELANGLYLTDSEINQVIQDMAAYADVNGIEFNSISDVTANQDLMNIIANSWHA